MTPLQICYSKLTGLFGAGGTSYDALGHRGADYSVQDGWIYAYDDVEIESIDYGSGLGHSVGLRRKTIGGFCGYAHIKNLQGEVGTTIRKGEKIAQCATYGDDHGSLWQGPHKHTTQGTVSAYNCSVGIRPLSDPAATIAAAISNSTTAGDTSVDLPSATPITPDSVESDDIMNWNFIGGAQDRDGVWIVGPKGSKHLNGQEFDLLQRLRIIRVGTDGKLVGSAQMNGAEMSIVSAALAQVC